MEFCAYTVKLSLLGTYVYAVHRNCCTVCFKICIIQIKKKNK